MLEALEYYQSLAQKFQSQLLTGPGIIIVLTGLCVWLAGLRWRRTIGALAGVVIAATGVFIAGGYSFGFAQDRPAKVVLAACAAGLLAGVIINRIVFGIFGAAIIGLLVIIILTGGLTKAEASSPFVSAWPEYEQSDAVIDTPTAMKISTQMAEYFIDKTKKTVTSAPMMSVAVAGLAAVIAALVALLAPRWFIAFVSSALGSAVIFAGMIILLFYKGSNPINCIAQRPQFYATAFGAMVIFGTLVQLILSPAAKAKTAADETKGEK